MHNEKKTVLLVAMPFAGTAIPSIQLPVLEGYCREHSITIETRHLYLKAAELYGITNYNSLIYPPNDSYTAQMVFSKYVFPEHWKNNEEKFREYFNAHALQSKEHQQFSFEEYVQRTDRFYQWALEHVDWRSFDIIGFTLNYGQLLPSLALAQKIKVLHPEKKIIFGGSRVIDALGVNVLRAFECVDFVVSGDGEDALATLASDYENYESIPRLMYRKGDEVLWNRSDAVLDLNQLPIPSYDQYYNELGSTGGDIQQYFQYYGRLPVEISRGCWWNQCTFCNLNVQHHCYREKSVDRIIEEIQWLSDRYKMLDFQIIGNTLPHQDSQQLFEQLKKLRKDMTFFAEARAGQLTSSDYTLMKEAGFVGIQTGIESFSKNYLQKMKKGTRVIDNIAALKFCKENGIVNAYNLLVNYPNEEPQDFQETQQTTQLFKQYLDPPQLCQLRVLYGSPIQKNPGQFNIASFDAAAVDKIMYPKETLDKGFNFVYEFKRKTTAPEHPWAVLVEEWRTERERLTVAALKSQTPLDRYVFYFVDGGGFLKIYDKRDGEHVKIFILNELERAVLLSCIDVVSYPELQEKFPEIPDFQLTAILETFEQSGIVFKEDDRYLSLPLRYSLVKVSMVKRETAQPICS